MSEHRETKFDGKTALIIANNHPRKNETAICMGADYTQAGWAMKFKIKNTGEEFYVFDGKQVKWID